MRNWIFRTRTGTSSRSGANCPAFYHTNTTRSDAHTRLDDSVNLFIFSKIVPLIRMKGFFLNFLALALLDELCVKFLKLLHQFTKSVN